MKNTTVSLLFFVLTIPLSSQSFWQEITFDRIGTHLVFKGDNLWVGTNGGGIYKWNTISNEYEKFSRVNNGLSDNFIHDLVIDLQGNIWVATNNGLSMYDGDSWQLFDETNSDLPTQGIMSLAADPNGTDIWVGTFEHGLFSFDGNNWTNFNTSNSGLADNFVTSIEVEPDGTLWIGAWGDGIDEFDRNNWLHHPGPFWVKAAGMANIWAWSYSETFGGFVAAVHQYDGENWTTYNEANSNLISDLVSSIAIAPNGEVWFGTNAGISVFNGENWRDYSDIQPLVDLNFSNQKRIAVKENGEVWFGTATGISKLENNRFIAYQTDGLADNAISDIEIGLDNRVWIANRGGLQVFNEDNWRTYTPDNSQIQAFDIKALALDQSGTLWIGAQNGLSQYDGEDWTFFNTENSGLISNAAAAIAVDKANSKWIGTRIFGNRVSRLEGDNWDDFEIGFSSLRGRTIAVDTLSETVWFATNQGVWQYDQPVWTKFTSEDGLVDNRVTSIAVDIDGIVWFGTIGGGICSYDGNEWTTFFPAEGGTIATINDIAIESDGTKWFATHTFGVKKYDNNEWTDYTWHDGLTNDRVYSIAIDQDNNKWFGTDFGISIFNENGIISNMDEIGRVEPASSLLIYPNPSNGRVQIEFSDIPKEPVSIQVFNLMGQIVFEKKSVLYSNEIETLDLFSLSKGAYFIKVRMGERIKVEKLILN